MLQSRFCAVSNTPTKSRVSPTRMGNNQSENDRRPDDTPTPMNRDDTYGAGTSGRHHKRDDDSSYGRRDDSREYDNDRNKQSSGSFRTDNPIAHGIGMTSSLFKGTDKSNQDRSQQQDDPSGGTYSDSTSRGYDRDRDDSYTSGRGEYTAGSGGSYAGSGSGSSYAGGSSSGSSYAGRSGGSYGQGRDDDAYAGSQGYSGSSKASSKGRDYAGDDTYPSNPSGTRSSNTGKYGSGSGGGSYRNASDDRY
jgi:hypothetical protein